VDAGTLTFELRSHDLADVVREAIAAAEVGDHPVTTDLQQGVVARVDRRWLGYAVKQGVDNAARFSPDGAPITVGLREASRRAIIEITDRGPGVPPDRRERSR
jgi:K+-sensing histidine kinase KdpD